MQIFTNKQVRKLAKILGIPKEDIRQIIKFEMPNKEIVQKFVEEHSPALSMPESYQVGKITFLESTCEIEEVFEKRYEYYDGHTARPQRRLIRYFGICLALFKHIDLKKNPQIVEDLKELDIDIENQDLVKYGFERIRKSFPTVKKEFFCYSQEANEFFNYTKKLDPLWNCYSNEEKFRMEALSPINFLGEPYSDQDPYYIKPTERQLEEAKKVEEIENTY